MRFAQEVALRDIKESDWKLFRDVRAKALELFCERALTDLLPLISREGKTWHERYLDVYRLIDERDDTIAKIFNDFRRSTALLQLKLMHEAGFVTKDEAERFSPEAREWLAR